LARLTILDTGTVSLYERGLERVTTRIARIAPHEVAVTILTAEEQFSGRQATLRKARSSAQLAEAYQRMTDTMRVLSDFHMLTFSEAAIARYLSLLALKLNVGRFDLKIAAIALEEDAVVITRNLRDFGRVPGLACENWAD